MLGMDRNWLNRNLKPYIESVIRNYLVKNGYVKTVYCIVKDATILDGATGLAYQLGDVDTNTFSLVNKSGKDVSSGDLVIVIPLESSMTNSFIAFK